MQFNKKSLIGEMSDMELAAASIFKDNMVLQRGKEVAVWGSAESGSLVTVEINGVSAAATAVQSKWMVKLPPMEACTGCEMRIKDDKGGLLVFGNVALGEVWIAGGQSNMEMAMYADADFEEAKRQADFSDIRFYDVPKVSYEGQMEDEDYFEYGIWRSLTPDDIEYFSAVGHHFAKVLYEKLNVPVGIVGCNWGGSPAAAWTDESYLTGELECYLRDNEEALKGLDFDEYARNFKAERRRVSTPEAKKASREMMKTPVLKPLELKFPFDESKMLVYMNGPYSPFRSCGLYHTMLEKIMPYTAAGVIWYQGEADTNRADIYDKMFGTMIRCWRDGWNEELPFLFVQLAPLGTFAVSKGETFVPIRAMQEKVSKTVPKAYMACIMDAGMEFDIHPKKKKPVGERLALLALGKVYGKDILCESPEAVGISKENGAIKVTFDNAGEGLYVSGEKINAVELYIDGKPEDDYTAKAEGSQLLIKNPRITENTKVELRFAWVGYCEVNLYNSAGLPAKPFVLCS